MAVNRKYPIGIQTFSRIISEGYVYVDKTDLIWDLQSHFKYVFLSRPRRFGKSLLTSTMDSFFKGDKNLFEGLKIMQMEKDWTKHPVIHLDLSTIKGMSSEEDLKNQLFRLLLPYEKLYGIDESEITPGNKLGGIIRRAYEQTGEYVAVIIDEYDSALLDVLHDESLLEEYRRIMQEFYQVLKPADPYLCFCFLTGITRLSQLNIFSALNNLTNISLNTRYSTICGITEDELLHVLGQDIRMLAKVYDCSKLQMKDRLKNHYDGYHFSEDSSGVYNPYSLLSAFANRNIGNYWFETGTPTFLIRLMKQFRFNITNMDDIETTDYAISRPTEAMTTMIPLLYQTGYLTIKEYDREGMIYKLSIPNQEVRTGYADGLLPSFVGLEGEDVQAGFALKFWRALKKNDVDLAMREMQTYMASIPYVEGFKKKLSEAVTVEGFYEYTLYLIFSMLNVYVRTQVKCAGGRIDIVVHMPDTTYVFELKTRGTAQDALQQITENGYALPYQTEEKQVVKIGVKFDVEKRIPQEWVIE